MHHSSTADVINANDEPVAVSSQVLFFDLSDMPQDAVIAIANLKVEGGALATPWRMGNDEIEQMARQAMQMASDAENVALHYITDTTDGIVVHPEGELTTGWSMRAALELIKSGISYIKAWIDGVIPKVRIGIENAGHILIDHDSVDVNDGKVTAIGEEIVALRNEKQELMSDNAKIKGLKDRVEDLDAFIDRQPTIITEYSEDLVRRLIETITVYDDRLVVKFKSGIAVDVDA